MEASALSQSQANALVGRSPLLRLQSDEKLIALIRRGHHGAFEALVQRYQSRLLAFCRHMLNSQEDAEDVLQEVFASAFNAICADERHINARPWLYRIARNRCLNHLRRPVPSGQDSMDVFERDGGVSTADTVHKREEFRQIVSDVNTLPETQRTALLLREIDALSYDQIAEAMDTTVPSVKSLLVRARVSLAEAAESRLLTCEEVRLELGQVAEGIQKTTAPVRRHVKSCDRCRVFKSELRKTNKALAAVYPLGPLVILKKMLVAKVGASAGGAAGTAATGTGGGAIAGGAATAASGVSGGALSAGIGAIASKAAAGLAAVAIVGAGAVEVKQEVSRSDPAPQVAAVAPAPVAAPVDPTVREGKPQPVHKAEQPSQAAPAKAVEPTPAVENGTTLAQAPAADPKPVEQAPADATPPADTTAPQDKGGSTVTLPEAGLPKATEPEPVATTPPPVGTPTDPAPPVAETPAAEPEPAPAPEPPPAP